MELSLFQKILLSTDGTVTDLIALYTGEAIRVHKLEQVIQSRIAPAMLGCEGETRIMSRRILLAGASGNHLYAESLFVFERFSPFLQQQLLETDQPIGLLWKAARLETYRDIVEQKVAFCPEIAGHFALPATAEFVSRTYLIYQAGKPLGAITEKWPLAFFRA
ncbi:MAG TPA: chorismate pyruvate-lyase family protein [Steroidobacteraceae bacterium]|nr:chorismate pyruvate-lyase family protein [Steroidobacteraceae bacterium]